MTECGPSAPAPACRLGQLAVSEGPQTPAPPAVPAAGVDDHQGKPLWEEETALGRSVSRRVPPCPAASCPRSRCCRHRSPLSHDAPEGHDLGAVTFASGDVFGCMCSGTRLSTVATALSLPAARFGVIVCFPCRPSCCAACTLLLLKDSTRKRGRTKCPLQRVRLQNLRLELSEALSSMWAEPFRRSAALCSPPGAARGGTSGRCGGGGTGCPGSGNLQHPHSAPSTGKETEAEGG